MSTVIKVENISKQYRLGQVSTGTISHDVNRWWHKLRGKENPYLKIGEANDRAKAGNSDYVWALQDINFEVKQGEVLGIIGRNGAGKSTLLKILSRTTAPTTGSIKIKGRVASLLEVGTGFHPELSGRDNIFLNGAILGMTKKEIERRFDEIVDFAGVERYIDTPVKRYSSGMYVRLAFAVAAHLESEILIVDEVLAVGDAEFQKKCLGKMKDVSKSEGRTVLFVSHSINAIKKLCNSGILLKQGRVECIGHINDVVAHYEKRAKKGEGEFNHIAGNKSIVITAGKIISHTDNEVKINDEVVVDIDFEIGDRNQFTFVEFFAIVYNSTGEPLIGAFQEDLGEKIAASDLDTKIKLSFLANLTSGDYILSLGIFDQDRNFIDWVDEVLCFTVENFYKDGRPFNQRLGMTVGKAIWKI